MRFWLIFGVVATLATGCAYDDTALRAEISGLRNQVAEYNRRLVDLKVTVETLNHRVLLLEDEVDRLKRQAGATVDNKVSRLPLVRVKPQESGKAAAKTAPTPRPEAPPPTRKRDRATAYMLPEPDDNQPPTGDEDDINDEETHEINATDGVEEAPQSEGKKPAVIRSVDPNSSVEGPSLNERMDRDFQNALALYRSKDYLGSVRAFTQFLQQYPENSLGDDALFYIGRCYYEDQEYQLAIDEFRRVIDWPNSDRASEAMLDLGLCFEAIRDTTSAVRTYEMLEERYPGTPEATQAHTRRTRLAR